MLSLLGDPLVEIVNLNLVKGQRVRHLGMSENSIPVREDELPTSSPKRLKLVDTEVPTLRQIREAERKAEREKREAEKAAERQRKEANRLAEKKRREAEKQAEKERKEAERKSEKERKDKERQAEKERKEAERIAEKERKEKEKVEEKQKKLKAQPRINLFFKSQPETSNQPLQSSQGDSQSDYEKYILPFRVKNDGELYSIMCNYHAEPSEAEMNPLDWLRFQSNKDVKPKPKITNKEFQQKLAMVQESSQASELISQLRIRVLQFSHLNSRHLEDPQSSVNTEFRPPYVGTTRDISLEHRKLLARDPFRVDLDSGTAYEYDSEAEWDPEEGEDLNDEDEESDEEGEDIDDMKEFFTSDDEDVSAKRPKIVGPLVPVIVWGKDNELESFKIISDGIIDPLKVVEVVQVVPEEEKSLPEDSVGSLLTTLSSKINVEELKSAVLSHNNSTSTKTLIIELLKQQFPNALDKKIRQLFDKCMERVGKRRTEKRWVLTKEAAEYFQVDIKPEEILQQEPNNVLMFSTPMTPVPVAASAHTNNDMRLLVDSTDPLQTAARPENTSSQPASDQNS